VKGRMLKQKGFVRQLMKSVADHSDQRKERNARLDALTEDDVDILVTLFWETLARLLRNGKRVIFEGVMSFFTKPVKRKCYNMYAPEDRKNWFTYAYRIRNNVLDSYREKAETQISEAEYSVLKNAQVLKKAQATKKEA
jgi:cytochrome c-type biogenesis protein CcmE